MTNLPLFCPFFQRFGHLRDLPLFASVPRISKNSRGVPQKDSPLSSAAITRRTGSPTCARERDQEVVAATGAAGASEAMGKESLEVVLDPADRAASGWDGAGGRRAHSSGSAAEAA